VEQTGAGRAVPADFTEFVTYHGVRLARACAEVTGHDEMAHAMRDALLVSVAQRWPRWAAESRTPKALARLERLLRREARALGTAHRGALDLTSSLGLRAPPDLADDDEAVVAASVWQQAARARRRRWRVLALAGLAVVAMALVVPRDPAEPLPTAVPDGVTILPRLADLLELQPGMFTLPPYLLLDPASVDALPALTVAPLPRAALAAFDGDRRLVLVGGELGDDRVTGLAAQAREFRRLDHPVVAEARLVATSLSPDGTVVALPRGDGLVLVDVTTGGVRTVESVARQPEPPTVMWLGPDRVLLPGPDGSRVVDVTTGQVTAAGAGASDVLTPRGYASPRLTELVALPSAAGSVDSDPNTIRSVLTFWNPTGSATTTQVNDAPVGRSPDAGPWVVGLRRAVKGPPWLGTWAGPGWISPQLVARVCDPQALRLPRSAGTATAVLAAVNTLGYHAATLATTDGIRLEVLGFDSPRVPLIAAHGDGISLLIAWSPDDGALSLLTVLSPDIQVSVADLPGLRRTPPGR
jgi:hypothetical protein